MTVDPSSTSATAQDAAEYAARFQALVDLVDQAVFIFDADGRMDLRQRARP